MLGLVVGLGLELGHKMVVELSLEGVGRTGDRVGRAKGKGSKAQAPEPLQ